MTKAKNALMSKPQSRMKSSKHVSKSKSKRSTQCSPLHSPAMKGQPVLDVYLITEALADYARWFADDNDDDISKRTTIEQEIEKVQAIRYSDRRH